MRTLRVLATIACSSLLFLLMPIASAATDPGPPNRLSGVRTGHPAGLPTGRIVAAHSYAVRVERGLVPGRRTYGVAEVRIRTQDQEQPVWCVPAATRAVLSAFLSTLPSQTYLALLEGTDWLGTYLDRVPPVLNHYQQRIRYEYRYTRNRTEYREQVRTDIDVYRAPLILSVDPALLPWYGKLGLSAGNHAIVSYGYVFTPRFAGIQVWDPSGRPEAGRRIGSVEDLWRAGLDLHDPVVW